MPTLPLQSLPPAPPLALQPVAPLVSQLNCVTWPVSMALGIATKALIVGAIGVSLTVTVTELGALAAPVPVQVNV